MDDIRPLVRQMRSVYALFAGEHSGHYYFKDNFSKFREQLSRLAAERGREDLAAQEAAAKRFHRIKGGAGFLKLEECRVLAAEGEQLFKSQESDPAKLREALAGLLSRLQQEMLRLKALLEEVKP